MTTGKQRGGKLTPEDALEVLERCEAEGVTGLNRSIMTFTDGETMHAGPSCLGVRHAGEMTFRELIALKENAWCDCGGWRGTRTGQLLSRAAIAHQWIDQEAEGRTLENWEAVGETMRRRDLEVGALRSEEAGIEQLIALGRDAALHTARRSARRLGTAPLERIIAAQVVSATVTPEEAEAFVSWARRKRLGEQSRELYIGNHERALNQALESTELVLLAITPSTESAATTPESWLEQRGLPQELALKLWAEGIPHQNTLLHERRAVAKGAETLARRRGAAAAEENETDPVVLETLRTIWFEEPNGWRNLQEALEAARALVR